MLEYEVFPTRWGHGQIITSPVKGNVKSIEVKTGEKVSDQQLLVLIREERGKVKQVLTGASGIVETLSVKVGDKVVRGDVLLFIRED
ncbi:biotin/lipoyl-binding protein [Virgibacillus ihumii]|uniref:biotin/lipoyl-binding protein n=1 Tax=Virgibacillus ihumii TaxID=2686091 RepID=UPI00157C3756|nr:biotin/lipoyl-binding protein [Virgibacillus ihumii]